MQPTRMMRRQNGDKAIWDLPPRSPTAGRGRVLRGPARNLRMTIDERRRHSSEPPPRVKPPPHPSGAPDPGWLSGFRFCREADTHRG